MYRFSQETSRSLGLYPVFRLVSDIKPRLGVPRVLRSRCHKVSLDPVCLRSLQLPPKEKVSLYLSPLPSGGVVVRFLFGSFRSSKVP